jgi:hypothetical protein
MGNTIAHRARSDYSYSSYVHDCLGLLDNCKHPGLPAAVRQDLRRDCRFCGLFFCDFFGALLVSSDSSSSILRFSSSTSLAFIAVAVAAGG